MKRSYWFHCGKHRVQCFCLLIHTKSGELGLDALIFNQPVFFLMGLCATLNPSNWNIWQNVLKYHDLISLDAFKSILKDMETELLGCLCLN